jgi:Periplasmic copper-binding protein (NosD)
MTHTRQQHGRAAASAIIPGVALAAAVGLGCLGAPGVRAQSPQVLLVGPSGTAGAQFTSIQAAVNQAQPGDWVLVAPGVYHEKGTGQSTTRSADVLITTPGIHLRGMNRDTVIVDGTNLSAAQPSGTLPAGSAACSSDIAVQDFGPKDSSGTPHVREGVEAYKASGVSIENLSVCNSLDNEIWWNNGDGSGVQTPMTINGDYITATSTFFKDANTQSAQYGIFTSNEEGPGLIDHSYANNMTDSSYYVGSCRNCNMTLNHPHAENSALGLSSTNAGGNFTVENGEWDLNRTGLVSNAQNNDDFPSPQYGQCVAPATSPSGAGPNSCDVWTGNFIYDNNNPNTPGSGLTAVSAVGTGIELVATQHISVVGNRIENNGAWGVVAHDFPDPESGPANCGGGIDVPPVGPTPEVCLFYSRGNFVARNSFSHNGFFGNPGNADIANEATGAAPVPPTDSVGMSPDPNCFSANTDASGTVSADPPTLQSAACSPANSDTANAAQLVCATGALSLFTSALGPCPATPVSTYPQHDGKCGAPAVLTPAGDTTNGVCFLPLSYTLSAQVSPPMPDPCAGVPSNAFCPATTAASTGAAASSIPNTGADRTTVAWVAGLLLLAAVPVLRRRAQRRG